VDQIRAWDAVKMLTVVINRPGALLIGDAAHAMSPIGGVGINLAVQDAVATARLLAPVLRDRGRTDEDLDAALDLVRRRRWFPTAGTQLGQRLIQRLLIGPTLAADRPVRAPLPMRLAARFPALQALPARAVGVGLRPEHIDH
jgi:2-polyprenyl-6-methoxyphenol hydroxylase-like FAD-dependent oxidoreductase